MEFNQTNNNTGEVNNAISEKGNVVQTTGGATGDVNNAATEKGNVVQASGGENKQQVDQPKPSFWSMLWGKVRACWKWLFGPKP